MKYKLALSAFLAAAALSAQAAPSQYVVKYAAGSAEALERAQQGLSPFDTITVEDGGPTIDDLRASDKYESVEPDLMMQIVPPAERTEGIDGLEVETQGFTSAALLAPNDLSYTYQYAWQAHGDGWKGRSNILAAYQASTQNKRLRVGVIDTGFTVSGDLSYAEGTKTTTKKFEAMMIQDEPRGPDYLESTARMVECGPYSPSLTHGTTVAAIIAGVADNDYAHAGILDADIVAVKAMTCQGGLASDISDGIRWAAGGAVTGVTSITQPVDIINLSVAATANAPCPAYTQAAIDYAVDQGIPVVVAAGNNFADATQRPPGNCQNVITVGAVNKQGYKAGFSNSGNNIALVAAGVDVQWHRVITQEVADGWTATYTGTWTPGTIGGSTSGTSFAAPAVAGMMGLVKQQHPDLTPAELKLLMMATARQPEAAAIPEGKEIVYNGDGSVNVVASETSLETCTSTSCGAGVANALDALLYASELNKDYIIRHALSSDNCSVSAYEQHLSGMSDPCDRWEATAVHAAPYDGNTTYELYEVPDVSELRVSNGALVHTTTDPVFVFSALKKTGYNYGLRVCATAGPCSDDILIAMEVDLASAPENCSAIE